MNRPRAKARWSISRLSTGITYQLIPKTTADNIPMHTMGYGRTSAKNGDVFSHTFNYPANYWDGASGAVNYLLEENGGDLSGKKIALVYHNSAYGKEPIRTLEELSARSTVSSWSPCRSITRARSRNPSGCKSAAIVRTMS